MYSLYTDKHEDFICEVQIKNASLKGSKARLVVESADGINLIFNGKIENGKCNIPIRRLKGLLEENTRGTILLEIIVEDTYFTPWKDNFIVEEHTSVKVKLDEQRHPAKPSVIVKVPSKSQLPKKNEMVPLIELSRLCEKFNIKKANIIKRKNDFRQLVNEYFRYNPEFISQKTKVLQSIKHLLK